MKSEHGHEWVEARLSEYLDGSLAGADRRRIERHLEGCRACSHLRADLESLVGRAGRLGPVEPPTDLWPGIADAIGAEPGRRNRPGGTAADVVALPVDGRGPSPGTERAHGPDPSAGAASRTARRTTPWRSRPALAAAAVVLVTVSAALAWWGRGAFDASAAVASGEPVASSPVRPASTGGAPASEELALELERLESVLTDVRGRLDPNTVSVLERNLVLIERAIEDSYRALALDPENEFVRAHLERAYERKAEFLRRVSRIAEIAG